VGTVNEPTAALLGYALDQAGTLGIGDIGGGTFDLTFLRVEEGHVYTTLATGGQNDLGGREYTLRLVELCVEHAARAGVKLDPAADLRDMVAIEIACEDAKKELTNQKSAFVSFRAKDRMLDLNIERSTFEERTADLTGQMLVCMQETLERAGMTPSDIDALALAGGGSRVPSIREGIEALLGSDKVKGNIDPDRAIVTGACLAIGLKLEEHRLAGDAELLESVPEYLLKGQVSLREITGQALGVAAVNKSTGDHVLVAIVDKGAPLPASEAKVFGLSHGDAAQVNAPISVLEGESGASPSECHALAEFPLEGLPAGPVDDRIEVHFDVSTDGLVEVHAMDRHSGKEIRQKVDAAGVVKKESAT